jgi:zinc protease
MMKYKLIAALLLLSVCIYSQEFKEVKTAQDVIDNYMTANGGAENLKKIRSIEMTGNMTFMGGTFPIVVYTSYDYFYMNGESGEFKMTIAMNLKDMIGWQTAFGMYKEADAKEIERNKANIESMMWTYYTDKDSYGITYKLMQNETVNGSDTYTVDFMAGDSVLQTCNYDAKTFHRVRQVKGKTTSEYSDLRNIENTGIYMAYAIKTNQGDVAVTDYKFNTEFDTSLLKKPEGK